MNTETIPTDANDAATETVAVDIVETVRILGTSTCPSLSAKSTLTYNLGMDVEGQTHIQIIGNDGGGYFNIDWVTYRDIQAVLAKQPKDITSGALRCLYPLKSTNSPGFLLAALKAVGLAQVSTENPRCYEALDPAAFIAGVKTLMESAPALDAPPKSKTLTLKGKPKKV